jgi:flavodoxin
LISRRAFLRAVPLLALGAVASTAALFGLTLWKDRSYFASPPYRRERGGPANVLVLYYSRSGNTEAMAREIARRYQADIVALEAEAYPLDFGGWRRAGHDAWNRLPAAIAPETLDITTYDLVFLGAPIWWFRPAPPLWTLVRNTAFRGKPVVLFNTFNSRFKSEEIDEFGRLIAHRGGRLIDHVYVRRGRILNQLSGNELMERVRDVLDTAAGRWPVIGAQSVRRNSAGHPYLASAGPFAELPLRNIR